MDYSISYRREVISIQAFGSLDDRLLPKKSAYNIDDFNGGLKSTAKSYPIY